VTESVSFAAQFCGPPTSANGGYCSGVLARFLEGTARVTLRKPIPLEKALSVARQPSGAVRLLDGAVIVADAEPAELALETPPPPTLAQAEAAAAEYPGLRSHAFPTCFVCGPQNAQGLHIFSGPVAGHDLVAAPWRPAAAHASGDGRVRLELLWAVLDCPGFWASMLGGRARPALLGQFTVQIEQPVRAGETYILAGWPVSRMGRKHRVGTALFSASGARLAGASAVWIEPQGPAKEDSA